MNKEELGEIKPIANSVFSSLQKRGPLCPSQLSFEVGRSVVAVKSALNALWVKGLAEPGEDRETPCSFDETSEFESRERPWRIRIRSKDVQTKRCERIENGEVSIGPAAGVD